MYKNFSSEMKWMLVQNILWLVRNNIPSPQTMVLMYMYIYIYRCAAVKRIKEEGHASLIFLEQNSK